VPVDFDSARNLAYASEIEVIAIGAKRLTENLNPNSSFHSRLFASIRGSDLGLYCAGQRAGGG
jgi:hypothetical protein